MSEISKQAVMQLYKEHPKHYVAVDCVIFGYRDGQLSILMYPRAFEPQKGKWSLPGGFVQEDESSDEAAIRVLKKTTGLDDIFLQQVSTFSDPKREKVARVVSIAYYALIRIDQHDEKRVLDFGASWCPVAELPSMVFDHEKMVVDALAKLQRMAGYELIGKELLSELFTLTQLRNLYGAIFQREFDPGNFRKKVLSLGVLEKTNKKDPSESKKGAFFYKYTESDVPRDIGRIVKV
ncbi:NUDIX hydrolase [Sunxiuqinia sp. A32]|uniref:NUDIX hydrolase n=1 Tax=Sunxiuqinia sp. A32 TaxID=3461496 RepID=UPI004045CAD7